MKMFRGFTTLMAAFVLFMTLSVGIVTVAEANKLQFADNVHSMVQADLAQNQEVEVGELEVVDPRAEESLKICKDDQGNAKVCSDKDLLAHLMLSIGGFKGMSALAIAFFIAKFLLLLLLSPFFTTMFPSLLKGSVKLLVATGLNLVVGLLSLMLPPVELTFGAAIMHSSVLALASVFANQAYKQFLTAKGKA
jgi:hypothetical protein